MQPSDPSHYSPVLTPAPAPAPAPVPTASDPIQGAVAQVMDMFPDLDPTAASTLIHSCIIDPATDLPRTFAALVEAATAMYLDTTAGAGSSPYRSLPRHSPTHLPASSSTATPTRAAPKRAASVASSTQADVLFESPSKRPRTLGSLDALPKPRQWLQSNDVPHSSSLTHGSAAGPSAIDDDAEFAQALATGDLLDCAGCQRKRLPKHMLSCEDAHVFCGTCVQNQLNSHMVLGHATMPCLHSNCQYTIPRSEMERVCSPEIIRAWDMMEQTPPGHEMMTKDSLVAGLIGSYSTPSSASAGPSLERAVTIAECSACGHESTISPNLDVFHCNKCGVPTCMTCSGVDGVDCTCLSQGSHSQSSSNSSPAPSRPMTAGQPAAASQSTATTSIPSSPPVKAEPTTAAPHAQSTSSPAQSSSITPTPRPAALPTLGRASTDASQSQAAGPSAGGGTDHRMAVDSREGSSAQTDHDESQGGQGAADRNSDGGERSGEEDDFTSKDGARGDDQGKEDEEEQDEEDEVAKSLPDPLRVLYSGLSKLGRSAEADYARLKQLAQLPDVRAEMAAAQALKDQAKEITGHDDSAKA